MSTITIDINGKPYVVGCEDGQEARLKALAAEVDQRVRLIAPQAAGLGDTRLMLMAAVMIADDLDAARAQAKSAEARLKEMRAAASTVEARAVAAIEAAAGRLETLAPE